MASRPPLPVGVRVDVTTNTGQTYRGRIHSVDSDADLLRIRDGAGFWDLSVRSIVRSTPVTSVAAAPKTVKPVVGTRIRVPAAAAA